MKEVGQPLWVRVTQVILVLLILATLFYLGYVGRARPRMRAPSPSPTFQVSESAISAPTK